MVAASASDSTSGRRSVLPEHTFLGRNAIPVASRDRERRIDPRLRGAQRIRNGGTTSQQATQVANCPHADSSVVSGPQHADRLAPK